MPGSTLPVWERMSRHAAEIGLCPGQHQAGVSDVQGRVQSWEVISDLLYCHAFRWIAGATEFTAKITHAERRFSLPEEEVCFPKMDRAHSRRFKLDQVRAMPSLFAQVVSSRDYNHAPAEDAQALPHAISCR